ncbi:MAG: BlaI/MecI/CopY family transcriptional regulator [Longimicrobiales bacterium]|nr:BlaI/MecI/CopY family transcriptional regulator [Longimicrobiales bacterium]
MDVKFTERELDIMQVLWDRGPCTVSQVREALEDELAHNTVLTMLKVLEGKGHVRCHPEERAHRFEALVPRASAGASALRRVTRTLFGGSAEELVLKLVDAQDLDDAEIARLRDLLDARLSHPDTEGSSDR